jgi:hypothetical protein
MYCLDKTLHYFIIHGKIPMLIHALSKSVNMSGRGHITPITTSRTLRRCVSWLKK